VQPVRGSVSSAQAHRDLDQHAGAVCIGAHQDDREVIGLGEQCVEWDRPRKLVVGRVYLAMPCLHLLR
jgi:hypothetical protein